MKTMTVPILLALLCFALPAKGMGKKPPSGLCSRVLKGLQWAAQAVLNAAERERQYHEAFSAHWEYEEIWGLKERGQLTKELIGRPVKISQYSEDILIHDPKMARLAEKLSFGFSVRRDESMPIMHDPRFYLQYHGTIEGIHYAPGGDEIVLVVSFPDQPDREIEMSKAGVQRLITRVWIDTGRAPFPRWARMRT